ncbi:hypothetical protein Tco_1456993 [Tanacetum coccineum]
MKYAPSVNQQSKFSQPDSGLIVPVFQKGNDAIDVINHMMSFLTAVVTSRYPTTNNQLRNSSNPRQQATINNGRVTLQPIQGRQTSLAAGTSRTYTPGAMEKQLWKQRTDILLQLKRGEIYGIPEGQAYRTYALVEVSIDTLTAEHDRYKRTHVLEIRYSNATQLVLEGQNVDLKSKDNERITKKRTKNKAKTTKLDSEWKRL